jgi:hypothetical protein
LTTSKSDDPLSGAEGAKTIKEAVSIGYRETCSFRNEYKKSGDREDRVSHAKHRNSNLDPDFVVCFSQGLHEESVAEALDLVLPDSTSVIGGNIASSYVSGAFGVSNDIQGFAFSSESLPDKDHVIVLASCWPSVKTKCVLTSGYIPLPQSASVRRDESEVGREIERIERITAAAKLDSWTGSGVYKEQSTRKLSIVSTRSTRILLSPNIFR